MMRRLRHALVYVAIVAAALATPAVAAVVYTTVANVFTANQRINAALGINIAPGATGTLSLSAGIFERGRAVSMGEWTSVTFNAANFTSSTGTWVVASGDQISYAWSVVGKTMYVTFQLDTTTVTGTPSELYIAIPGGAVAQRGTFQFFQATDNGTTDNGTQRTNAGDTVIRLQSTELGNGWVASTDNTHIRGTFVVEIQ